MEDVYFSNNTIEGKINVTDNKFLFLSIPYSEGWEAKVDGKDTEILKANIGFMAIPLIKGEHKVELRYRVPGGSIGTLLTIIGWIIFITLIVIKKIGGKLMNKKCKWIFYEKRCKFRNFYFHKVIRRHICEKYFNFDPVMHFYANKLVMGKMKTNRWLKEQIDFGQPFMAARFGNTELSVMTSVLKRRMFGTSPEIEARFNKWFARLGELSGFFPNDPKLAEKFTDLMLESCRYTDLLAMWHCEMDDYIITEYMPDVKLSFLNYLEPWRCKEPWSSALEEKKFW